MDIGSAIRQMREQLGLKLEAVAMEAGTDAGNLSRIETGKQKPSIGRLESIARAMNVGVTDLYALIENVRVLPATLRRCAMATTSPTPTTRTPCGAASLR